MKFQLRLVFIDEGLLYHPDPVVQNRVYIATIVYYLNIFAQIQTNNHRTYIHTNK